ncbi:MFS transporter [Ereboglobus luteus]|uniref:MFS transporter n=1 Tax=Ereboglobus luteus TaxID=1796921 RepID=A0A2U8E4V3_9BACT|nr:MFS transporter [Ereboglobus luteus]AWI09850.1 MFS transporter [Ereboglobus luteus]
MKTPKSSYKWQLASLFWVAYFLNQGDRQIFNVVIPLIKADLGLSDVQIGWVVSAFTLVYGVLVPVAGFAGDLVSRKKIVFLSLLIFSVGTLLTGFAGGIVMLIVFRSITTGGGEAFYYPAATSLLAQFHPKTRATALSLHQTSLYAGIIASGFIAGYIGERYGWRAAFFTFGGVGILWALVVWMKVHDTPMPEPETKAARHGFAETVRAVFSRRTVWFLSLAFGCMQIVSVGYLTWIPTYLYEKFGLSLAQAGLHSTLYHFVFAFLGVMLGARISDRLSARRKTIRMEIEIAGLLLGAPFIYWIAVAGDKLWCYVAMGAFGIFRGMYDSNLFAALYDVIEPRYRASSMGVMLSFAFVIGAIAPVLLGYIKTAAGLDLGIMLLSVFYALGAALVLIGMKFFFPRDFYQEQPNQKI